MATTLNFKLKGIEKLLAQVSHLSKAAEGKAARRAIRAASRIVVVDARRRVPVETGLLKRSLGVRVKTYRGSGTTVGVVGPRRGEKYRVLMKGQRSDLKTRQTRKAVYRYAVRYAHLVERGTKFVRAQPFLRPALESNKRAIEDAMAVAIRKELL